MMNTRTALTVCCAALALAGACSSSGDGGTTPGATFSTLTVDATKGTAYVSLGTTASLVSVSDPTTSTAWDLAFTATPTVAVNGGASGPGGATAYCLCANAALSLAQIEALTAQSASDAFGAVAAANVPPDSSFQSDAASQAIDGWYDYDPTTHVVSTNTKAWGLLLASTSGAYAKFHVTAIPTPGASNAGPVTIEWAVQSTSSGTLGADRQLVVDLSSGAKVYVNLTTGASSTSASSAWDVALQNYTIFVNGGSSGTGGAGAVLLVPSSFYASYAAITSIPVGAQGIPTSAFVADGAGGAFLAAAPYRYDGTSHQVYPTYDVYLVKHGSEIYKVQITSYYSTAGVFGVLTLRYAKVAG